MIIRTEKGIIKESGNCKLLEVTMKETNYYKITKKELKEAEVISWKKWQKIIFCQRTDCCSQGWLSVRYAIKNKKRCIVKRCGHCGFTILVECPKSYEVY